MFNFSTNATKLIRSYLTNRFQTVGTWNFSRGVPQESVLGSLFFSIYVNDLLVSCLSVEYIYADDFQIYVS